MNQQTRTILIQIAIVAFVLSLLATLLAPQLINAVKTQQDRAALAASQDDWAVVTLYGNQTYRLKVRQSNRVCLEGTLSMPDTERGRRAGSHTLIVTSEVSARSSTVISLRSIQAATLPGAARINLPLRACPGVISGLSLSAR